MNNKDPNRNKINTKLKNIQNSKNKLTSVLDKASNLEKERQSKSKSSQKKNLIKKRRTIKINSYSSSHDDNTNSNFKKFKNRINKQNKLKFNIINQKNSKNNSTEKNNKCYSSISKE